MRFTYEGYSAADEAERGAFRDKLVKLITDWNEKSGPTLEFFISSYDIFPWLNFN